MNKQTHSSECVLSSHQSPLPIDSMHMLPKLPSFPSLSLYSKSSSAPNTNELLLLLGLDENHGAKVKKSWHTFRKVAKFTANSRCQFTVIYSVNKRLIDKHFCSLPSQQSVMYRHLTK